MRCPAVSFLLTVGLSGLIDGLPNPSPITEKARGQVNPDSYCTNFSCTPPAVPIFNQVFNTCGCKIISASNLPRDKSIQATCPGIVCGAGSALDSNTCACEPIWPPDACPVMKCTAGHHAVYNSTSGGCNCDLDCPSLTCTTGYTSFYNSSTRACTCQKASAASAILRARSITSSTINQLPSTTTHPLPTFLTVITDITVGPPMHHTFQTSKASLAPPPFYQTTPVANPSATASTAILLPSGTACRDLYCISEMTPQFDSVSGQCKCVWISGFGPSGT